MRHYTVQKSGRMRVRERARRSAASALWRTFTFDDDLCVTLRSNVVHVKIVQVGFGVVCCPLPITFPVKTEKFEKLYDLLVVDSVSYSSVGRGLPDALQMPLSEEQLNALRGDAFADDVRAATCQSNRRPLC